MNEEKLREDVSAYLKAIGRHKANDLYEKAFHKDKLKSKRKPPSITLFIDGIPIKIQAEHWNKFKWAYLLKPDDFMKQLNDRIVDKVAEDEEKLKPLWGNRKKAEVIKWLKSEAGELYLIFSQLCAMLLKETPLWFQRLIKESKLTDPELLTAFCILKAYPQGLEENKLKKHFDVYAKGYNKKDLRRTYLAVIPERRKQDMLRRLSNALRNGAAEYLRKKKNKVPHAYTDILAMCDDMYPCDKAGNLLKQAQGKIRKSLIAEIFKPSDNFTLKKLIKP